MSPSPSSMPLPTASQNILALIDSSRKNVREHIKAIQVHYPDARLCPPPLVTQEKLLPPVTRLYEAMVSPYFVGSLSRVGPNPSSRLVQSPSTNMLGCPSFWISGGAVTKPWKTLCPTLPLPATVSLCPELGTLIRSCIVTLYVKSPTNRSLAVCPILDF